METEEVRPSDFLLECLMMGLRLSDGLPEDRLIRRFGAGFDELFPGLWDRWTRDGNAAPFDGTRRLTREGLMILDHLLQMVMDALPRQRVDAAGVRWPEVSGDPGDRGDLGLA